MKVIILSDKGGREYNEDYTWFSKSDTKGIFVLADGLGGHACGEVASKTACEAVIDEYNLNNELSVDELIETAQHAVRAKQQEVFSCATMKTTLVVLKIENMIARWGHAGDSRLYHIRKNKIINQTIDHSLTQALINAKQIKKKELRYHKDRSKVTKVIGSDWDAPEYEVHKNEVVVKKGDVFLLCTDGFWEHVYEKEMISTLKQSEGLKIWIKKMQESLLNKLQKEKIDNNDNYTALAMIIE